MKNLVRRRYWWFTLSLVVIVPGLYFLLLHPLVTTGIFKIGLQPSIDFSGGSLWEIHFPDIPPDQLNTESVREVFTNEGFEGALVQISTLEVQEALVTAALVRTKEAISGTESAAQQERILVQLQTQYGTENVRLERLESVGPTVSEESTNSAVIAVFGASIAILIYLTFAFRNAPHPFRYGMCAVISMIHDIVLIMGVASILGYFFGFEIDALFLTAMLTILSFSVHDTIVVFDRIRENLINQRPGETFDDIVNHSIVQTLPRSINTQLTTFFTLTALLLFGGASISHFITILLIGLVSGTYSSIFNAAQILVVWEFQEWKTWFNRGGQNQQPAPGN